MLIGTVPPKPNRRSAFLTWNYFCLHGDFVTELMDKGEMTLSLEPGFNAASVHGSEKVIEALLTHMDHTIYDMDKHKNVRRSVLTGVKPVCRCKGMALHREKYGMDDEA